MRTEKQQQFYAVWDGTGKPAHKFPTRLAAEREAKQLAMLQPDKPFYILQAVAVAQTASVVVTELVDCEY